MTDIDKMEAGREFDAVMATEVMEWHRVQCDLGEEWHNQDGHRVAFVESYHIRRLVGFYPTFNIVLAWEVLSTLYRDGPYKTGWSPCITRQNDGQWVCSLHSHRHDTIPTGVAPTAPLAICRAALTAVRTAKEPA